MFHTPDKLSGREESPRIVPTPPESTETAGPSALSQVRKSIDRWETKEPGVRQAKTTSQIAAASGPAAPPRPKQIRTASHDTRRASTEASGEPPATETGKEQLKPTDRVAQARVWLRKAKTHLSESRNLKTDLKAGITLALDELYKLIKEEAAEIKKGCTARRDQTYIKENSNKGTLTEGELKQKEKTEDNLTGRLDSYEKLLKQNNEAIENLKNTLENKLIGIDTKNTYASVAATGPLKRSPKKSALHSVVVTSNNELETADEVLKLIRENVNAKDGWVKVERVRKVKNQKVILGCATEKEREKLKERLDKGKNKLRVEDTKNKNPLIILKDVFNYNTDEEIMMALKNQNRSIFCDLGDEEQNIETCFRRRTRNPHACHIVMRVPPKVWQRATEAETVHIDLQKVRVADHSPLVQCSQCLGYGHTKRFCKEATTKCSHCGGPHTRTDCLDWIANVPPKCCNCTRVGLDSVTEHNAFSHDCPVRRKWDALARSSIAYC